MSLFSSTAGQFLKPDKAAELTDTYHQRKVSKGINGDEVIKSEFFGIENVRQLLNQPGVAGLRILHAKNWEDMAGNSLKTGEGRLTPRVVLVAVDEDGNEVVSQPISGLKDMPHGEGSIKFLAMGPICPPQCAGGGTGTGGGGR